MRVNKFYVLLIMLSGLLNDESYSQTIPGAIPVESASSVTEGKPEAGLRPTIGDTTLINTDDGSMVELGYYSVSEKGITGSIGVMSSFNQGAINDPMQLIQGRASGVNIIRPGGDPNEDFIVRVRGLSTVQFNTQPLIVIDGLVNASMLSVDPADVGSFIVLKDAASAALYGARGANGVILLTTKNGTSGRPTVEYNASYSFEHTAKKMEILSADEFRAIEGKPDFGSNTNWVKQITRAGGSAIHNVSFSGGSPSTSYRAAFNYRNVAGILRNSGFSQINGRVNLQQSVLNNRAKFTVNLSRTLRDREIGFPEAFGYALSADPTFPVYDQSTTTPYGGYAERDIFGFYNPVSIVDQNTHDRQDAVFSGRLGAEYDFRDLLSGLHFSIAYGYQQESLTSSSYFPKTSKYGNPVSGGLASRRLDNHSNNLIESLFHYSKDIRNTKYLLVAGYSAQRFFDNGFGMNGGNFLTDVFTYNNMGAALDFANGVGKVFSYAKSNSLEALFGSANIEIKDTYFFNFSTRFEGSSRFGRNHKRAVYPAASAAVVLTDMIDLAAINHFKLRVGYGITGNQPGEPYLSLERWGVTGTSFQDGGYKPVYSLIQAANPDLKSETKKEFNAGFDLALVGSRLTASFSYFNGKVDDLIFNIWDNAGVSKWANIGALKNTGSEFELSYLTSNARDFQWTSGLNISRVKTRILAMSKGEMSFGQNGQAYLGNLETQGCGCTNFIRIREGGLVGEIWGPVQRGFDENGEQIFADINGDGSGFGFDDRATIGNTMPDLWVGWSNVIVYRNFTLNALLQGAFGHRIVNNNRIFLEGQGSALPYNILKTKYYVPRVNGAEFSDYYVENGTYLRMGNITVAYRWKLKASSLLQSSTVNFSVQNLFTLSRYTGLDPEVRYFNSPHYQRGINPTPAYSPLTSGLERRSTYPRTRTFTIGLTVKI